MINRIGAEFTYEKSIGARLSTCYREITNLLKNNDQLGDDLDKLIDVYDLIVQLKKAITTLGESSATDEKQNVLIIFTEGSE